MSLSIIALLACGSDQNLQQEQQGNGGVSGCECVDNTVQVTELAAEVERLTREIERMDTDLAEIADDEPAASSLVVTEYDVDCVTGRDDEGEIIWTDPLELTDHTGQVSQFGCKLAELDPADLPFVFDVKIVEDQTRTIPTYSYEDSVERYGSDRPELYSWYTNFGNDLRYRVYHLFPLNTGYITSDGDFYDWNSPATSVMFDAETDEVIVAKFHIVIIDDKAYPTPDAW